MERIKSFIHRRWKSQEYEPVSDNSSAMECSSLLQDDKELRPFSAFEYSIFALLGMAMLWAWNMFLAASHYFQTRFEDDEWITQNFQSAILTVSTITNLGAMAVLTNMQTKASYPFRINLALFINVVIFCLLTISTFVFLDSSPAEYLVFLLIMVAGTAWAAGLLQNGAFAFAASFGRSEYIQAVMAGQGVAGVLPPLAQIFSVLIVPAPSESDSERAADENNGDGDGEGESSGSTSAFIYFLTAVAVSIVTLVAFVPLVRRHDRIEESRDMAASLASVDSAEHRRRRFVSPLTLLRKLYWLAAAVALCFAATTMFFPVFTNNIVSIHYQEGSSSKTPVHRIFEPAVFISVAFFLWNLGDLSGRMASALPALNLRHRPPVLLALSVARWIWLPLYLLCNIHGQGAIISSDLFYLFIVQFLFGLTNGWISSSCMMAGAEWVDEGEREAAGGFMGLCLVAGLAVGSVLSFTIAGI